MTSIGLNEIWYATLRLNAIAGEHSGPRTYPSEKICEILAIDHQALRDYAHLHVEAINEVMGADPEYEFSLEDQILKTFLIGYCVGRERG